MSALLIGADDFLRRGGSLPEEISKKIITSDHRGFAELRPPHHALNSGQHSLPGVELAGARLSSDER